MEHVVQTGSPLFRNKTPNAKRMGDIARFVMTGTCNEVGRHIGDAGHVLVFAPRQVNGKSHESITVAGKCYRFAGLGKGRFAKVFRCCDDSCCARVHFTSPDDYMMTGNHDFCSFDHERELRRRTRLELAWRIYSENITDTPAEIIRKMEVSMRLCPEEKQSVRTFVSTQRKKEFGETNTNGARVEMPDVLKTVKRPQSIEEDVSFLLHDSVGESSTPRIVIFFLRENEKNRINSKRILCGRDVSYRSTWVCDPIHHPCSRVRRSLSCVFLSHGE